MIIPLQNHFLVRTLTGLLLSVVTLSAEPREFTDEKGRKVVANFVGFKGKTAGLRLESGKVVYYPIARLSAADRDYLKNHPSRKLPPVTIDPKSRYAVHDKDANYYYIDLRGEKVFEAPIKNTLASQFDGKAALIDMRIFIDQDGKVLLDAKDTEALVFFNTRWSDDLLTAHDGKNRTFGFADHTGKLVVPTRYTRVLPMRDGVAWVSEDQNIRGKPSNQVSWKLINKKGEELVAMPKGASPWAFSDGYGLVTFVTTLKRSYAYYDTSGRPVFADKHLEGRLHSFQEGVAFAGNELIDRQGNRVIASSSGWDLSVSSDTVSDGVLLARKQLGKSQITSVLLAATGEVVSDLPETYGEFRLAGDGLIAVRRREDPKLWGCLDRLGNEVVSPKYAFAPVFTGGFGKVRIPVESKNRDAVIDREGRELWTSPF